MPIQNTLPSQPSSRPSVFSRRFVVIGLVILLVALAGAAIIITLDPFAKNTTTNTNQTISNEPSILPQKVTPPAGTPGDKDSDGLSDSEEAQLKTNAENADSDGDQLFDKEEVKIYFTDPLKADTDGDGLKDGEEVSTGQNPKGTGILRDLQQGIEGLNNGA
ncbi:MAG: hypothetical protein WC289_01605 [Patescibacteria group bacterium]|jgi:hypothetical protein